MLKKVTMTLALVVAAAGTAFAGACPQQCNSCPGRYVPGQCFVTNCGSGNGCVKCKPVCQPVCKPACQPVCKPACSPCGRW